MLSQEYANIKEFKSYYFPINWLTDFNANAIGIGYKVTKGKKTNQLALRIYVSKKRPKKNLVSKELVPPKVKFKPLKANEETEIFTDVIEMPAMHLIQNPENRHRPVPGGVSGGAISTGTIGGWIWDETDDTIVMLSNEHVLGHQNGNSILQPGFGDGGNTPDDIIGETKRGQKNATIDAAVGDPAGSDIYDLRVLEIGPAVYAIESAALDMEVEKFGQTTEHTYGQIDDTDFYKEDENGNVIARDMILIQPIKPTPDNFVDSGDSGSIIFSQEPVEEGLDIKPSVGLLFAKIIGGELEGFGVACKIQNVFDELNLTTLCDGAFSAIGDSMFEEEGESVNSAQNDQTFKGNAFYNRPKIDLPPPFSLKERLNFKNRSFYKGITRDLQKILKTSSKGQLITDFVNQNRARLLNLYVQDGDFRRLLTKVFKPFLKGSNTTKEVLNKPISKEQIQNLEELAELAIEKTDDKNFQNSVNKLKELLKDAEEKRPADILDL